MKYPKRLFPHIYEYQKLGVDKTPEGREYHAEHHKELMSEFSDVIDMRFNREKKGNKFFHKIKDDK